MSSSYRLVPPGDQRTTTWSGGTTTELAIFPPEAGYAERNFQWRISTAVVTVPESTFTSLPGWHRLLMVLSGRMTLSHSGYHQVTLHPFEQDSFSGGWSTHCTGTGRDFNLMLAGGWRGSLQALRLANGESVSMSSAGSEDPDAAEAFYCVSGRVRVWPLEVSEFPMKAGDFLLLERRESSQERLKVSAEDGPADLVRASVWPGGMHPE